MSHKLNRRDFLRKVGVTVSALALPGCNNALSNLNGRATQKPNILILFTDDQRFSTIGALDNPEIKTPNLDKLVRRGTTFTRAHIMGGCHGAICMPSRAMLITGKSYFHLPKSVTTTWDAPAEQRGDCPYVTFPELFRANDYATFGTGKWHNGKKLFAKGFTHGDEIFFLGMHTLDQGGHHTPKVFHFDPAGKYPESQKYTAKKFSSTLYSDAAINFLNQHNSDQPFLMYVSYTAPHDPRHAPKEYVDMYPPEKITLPKNFLPEHPFDNGELKIRDEKLAPFPRTPEIVREHLGAYYAMITQLDDQVGRILETLKQTGQADNTIIIFTSDNGLAVGQHGLLGKQNLYDHSVRVPLIISGPSIKKDRACNSLCYIHDIFPTICELSGLTIPESVESKSLVPLLKNPKVQLYESVFFAYRNLQRGIRKGNYKLIVYPKVKITQLFNLAKDPWETTNLAQDPQYSTTVKQLFSELKTWQKNAGDTLDLAEPFGN